ncbi:hypothetical protein ABZ721_15245 [Streptomyces sp. NPDC006733]|uniref:hypothetical protein n=1 Tax=Streptomyces sp. NPDC006733 TaxID=3155460 RepID=UPI0033C47192
MPHPVPGCTDPDPRIRLLQLVERGDALLRPLERAAARRTATGPASTRPHSLIMIRDTITLYQKIAHHLRDADLDDPLTVRYLADALDEAARCLRLLSPAEPASV